MCVHGGRRSSCVGQVVSQEGALEGRDGQADLKGYWQGLQRRGIPPGLDGPLQVCTRLPGGKAHLHPIAAFN